VIRRPASKARRAVPLTMLVVLAVAACEAPAASVAPTPTRAPEPTPVETAYTLATDVWYEGLVLHLDRATALLDVRGGTVDIAFRIENPGAEASDLDARMLLVVGGDRIEPTDESHIPTTPAGETTLALLTFELQEIASADDGVLQIGADGDHIARVPFGPEGGEPVTFEPLDYEIKGTNAAGDLRITVKRVHIRWDLPDWSQELDASLQALTLTYDATYSGEFSGGFAFTGDNVALKLPDGTIVRPRRDGHSQSVELIGAKKTKKGLSSRFEIPAGLTGRFSLLVRNGSLEKAIPFTIE
jgi:hypothetical protein